METGVILMNLGSPDSTSVKDVRRYLTEFLMDERVIDLPYINRLLLVKGIIVPFRSPRSARAYRSIWTSEGSPLIVWTKKLQSALKNQLRVPVEIAMRYGNPSPKAAYDSLVRNHPGLKEVLLLPLYPHFAMSSYETAADYARKIHIDNKYTFTLKTVRPFYNDEKYIQALAESILPYLKEDFDHLLFSYHGVPERHIYKGDITNQHCLRTPGCCEVSSPAHRQCYRHQCIITTRLVAGQLQLSSEQYSISFQSRLGRSEWLKPYTAARLKELPAEGKKRILVACPAFVSDCLETLEEIGKEGQEIFLHAGGKSFTMIPCLNVHPAWVNTIAHWVREFEAGNNKMLLT